MPASSRSGMPPTSASAPTSAALFAKHLLPDPLLGTGGRDRRRDRARLRNQRADPARLGPDPPDGDARHRARSSTNSPTASTGSPAAPTACRAWSWVRSWAASSSTCSAAPPTPTAWWCCSRPCSSAGDWSIRRSASRCRRCATIRCAPRASACRCGVGWWPIYTIAAGIAGAAGALLAQTSGFASLDVLDFHRSADVLLVLVIGGAGYLYGGIVGAVAFKLLHDAISVLTPQYWTFWLGLFLVVLVLVGRDRLVRPWTWFGRPASEPGRSSDRRRGARNPRAEPALRRHHRHRPRSRCASRAAPVMP